MAKSPNKRSNKHKCDPSQPSLTGWLSKSPVIPAKTLNVEASKKQVKEQTTKKSPNTISSSNKRGSKRKNIEKTPLNIITKKVENTVTSSKHTKKTNDLPKTGSKKTLKRFNSASSDELPTFREKAPRKRLRETETFKKYGVIVPSVDEIVADKTHLFNYKTEVEKAQTIKEPTFKMPSTPTKTKAEEQYLDCKHLSLEDISQKFNDNISFLSDVIKGKASSIRHRRYYDKKNQLNNLNDNDLTYSTSTVIFTFEQLDHMISLMQTQFDPDDKITCYFFKVLVPELCLKIFMETYNMNKREANRYLANCPVC